jgi:homogentisate 1,2-dioxygenase
VETVFIKIIFVKSENNKSDWFTKNVSSELSSWHMGRYIVRRSGYDDEC